MKITQLNYQTSVLKIQNSRRNHLKLMPALNHDTVCFKSRDLLSLPEKEIFKKVEESITPANFLGHGTEAEVYRIKDTNYCVRIPYISGGINKFNFSKDLTPIDRVNHVAAKLGFGATIIKFFDGITPKWYQNNDYNRYQLQEKISDMPVKSYTNLLHQIANAIDNEMLFDFSGGNLIVDTKNKKLTAIDFYGIQDNPRPIRPMTEIYCVLTCYGSEEKTGKKIFDKIIDAGLEEFNPYNIPCMDIELFDFIELVLKRNSGNNHLRRGNINKYINPVDKLINTIYENIKDLKQLKKKEITDKAVSKLLEEKVINCRRLLRRIK